MEFGRRNSLIRDYFGDVVSLIIKGNGSLSVSSFWKSCWQNNYTIIMSESAVTIRVRKFMRNPLLKRRQMVCLDLPLLSPRPLRWFIPSVLPFPRRRLRLTSARSTTWRTIRPSFSSVSRLLSVIDWGREGSCL